MKMTMKTMMWCVALAGCETQQAPPVEVDRKIEELRKSPIPEEASSEAAAWAKLGVAQVKTVAPPTGVDHYAMLFDAKGKKLGSIEVSVRIETWSVTTSVAGLRARFEMGNKGQLKITDLATGDTGEAAIDPATGQFTQNAKILELQEKFGDLIPVSMGTLNAIQNQKLSDATEESASPSPFDVVEPEQDAIWGCYGSWYRGGAYWGTRSGCCVIAKQDAAQQCMNSSCFGCCYYRACDVACFRGDYFCLCGISGRACS